MRDEIKNPIQRHPILFFYVITFGLSWAVLLIDFLYFHNNWTVQWIAVLFPALTALLMTYFLDGRADLERLIKRLFIWRVNWKVYVAILLMPFYWTAATVLLYKFTTGNGPNVENTDLAGWFSVLPQYLPVLLLLTLLLSVTIMGEEIGWRGYAQAKLQTQVGWFNTNLIIGLFWGLWHIAAVLDPNNFLNLVPLYISIPFFVLGCIEYSFIYTWLLENSRGSLLVVCLFHGFYDTFNTYASRFFPYTITKYWLQLIVILPLIFWMYRKRIFGDTD
jgi:membrane protease YdiL (CAAX protease family)